MSTILYGLIEQRPGALYFGHPFYVGVGTERRPRAHIRSARTKQGHRNPGVHDIISGHLALGIEPAIRIFQSFSARDVAFLAEIDLIAVYGRIGFEEGGILHNLSRGGTGPDSELMSRPEIAARNAEAQRRRSPESKAKSLDALMKAISDPEVLARRAESQREPMRLSWLDADIRARRIEAMTGAPKTMTPDAMAARKANANATRSPEALAAQLAAVMQTWNDPDFRTRRSEEMLAAWQDPEKRAHMLEGRSEAQTASWNAPEIREKRTEAVRSAMVDKWANDPDYAERARAGLRAAWQDPEKKAARVAKMRAAREAKPWVQTEEGAKNRSEAMKRLNAAKSTESRAAAQAGAWSDPEKRKRMSEALKLRAQDPELKARRLAAMAAGRRRKAAEQAALPIPAAV